MSLSKIRKIREEGATFQSHIDGSKHFLSPERAMEIQRLLGSDIQMQLDQCIEFPHTEKAAVKAMELSLRWAERSRVAFGTQPGRGNFGIVQGGTNERCACESAAGLIDPSGFEGYAIGGLAVGEGQKLMLLDHRFHHTRAADRQAALPHGCRHAG
jgi:queuine tRNA-ribosyltransferase